MCEIWKNGWIGNQNFKVQAHILEEINELIHSIIFLLKVFFLSAKNLKFQIKTKRRDSSQ